MNPVLPDYFPFAFGLDEVSGKQNPLKGRLINCENFELVLGQEQGLRRIRGYERMDGRARASLARYFIAAFNTGTSAIVAGNTVTTASGSGLVLRVQLDSGAWADGDAAGLLILTATSGDMQAGETISVGTPRAVVDYYTEGGRDAAGWPTDIVLAREHYRALIQQPTGEGEILGVAIYRGDVLCLRNATGGTTATLWKSSAGGWTSVRTGLRPGGRLDTVVANFSGDPKKRLLLGCDGQNRYWSWDGATFTFAPAVYDSEATSSDNETPGLGAKTFTVAEASRDFPVGAELRAYSAANAAKYMVGNVTGYSGSNVTINVTSFAGAAASDWHICLNDNSDRPFIIAEHRGYLALGYPNGQLLTSDNGDPMTFAATNETFALGDEIRDLVALRGGVLGVLCENSVSLLYGINSTAEPFSLKPHSPVGNPRLGSAFAVAGDAVFLADAGILTLSGSNNFGDFDAAGVATKARKSERRIVAGYRCATVSRADSQYRIYGADQQLLVMSFPGGAINRKAVEFTRLAYEHQAVCVACESVDGEEVMVFGTSDGWVMRDRVGTTFDGQDIGAVARLSYWHCGMPQVQKEWSKLTIDVDPTLDPITLRYSTDYDFAALDDTQPVNYEQEVRPVGARFDDVQWDQFYYDSADAGQVHASIDGVACFMSVLLYHEGDAEPFTLRGLHMLFKRLGLRR